VDPSAPASKTAIKQLITTPPHLKNGSQPGFGCCQKMLGHDGGQSVIPGWVGAWGWG